MCAFIGLVQRCDIVSTVFKPMSAVVVVSNLATKMTGSKTVCKFVIDIDLSRMTPRPVSFNVF